MFVGAHPLQVSMDHAVRVNVIEALCYIDQLTKVEVKYWGSTKKGSQERPDPGAGSI